MNEKCVQVQGILVPFRSLHNSHNSLRHSAMYTQRTGKTLLLFYCSQQGKKSFPETCIHCICETAVWNFIYSLKIYIM